MAAQVDQDIDLSAIVDQVIPRAAKERPVPAQQG